MEELQDKNFYRIGRVRISITNEDEAVKSIIGFVKEKQGGYICISNMRTVSIANKDNKYYEVMENSLMNTPDGTPLVWCGHWWGLKEVGRACGPHIFSRLLQEKDNDLRHFFLGDTDETLAALKKKVTEKYGTHVTGSYSPPFKPLEEYDIDSIAKIINESGATIVWTSLRAPKQDYLGALLAPYLNKGTIIVGVGAAFRCETGGLKQPDGFLQKIGLAGLLFKRKGSSWWKEFRWYAIQSTLLIKYFFTIKWRKFKGIKHYELKK